ncbi:MAG TPA: hypothetical protein VIF15_05425 [Polyangiaceae bacterium]
MIDLTKKDWDALYRDVLVKALQMTFTKDEKRKATQADRAREATQRVFDRYFRVRPPDVESIDSLRGYLVRALRSEQSNERNGEKAHKRIAEEAAVDTATAQGETRASPEQKNLERAQDEADEERDRRRLKALRAELAGDAIALGTLECIARDETEPAKQAVTLKCSVDAIHAARKRRDRARERVVAAERAAKAAQEAQDAQDLENERAREGSA